MDMPFDSLGEFVVWLGVWTVMVVVAGKVLFFLFFVCCALFSGENAGERWRRENATSVPPQDRHQQTREPEPSP